MTSPQRPRAAATPTAPGGMRDDPELPNKILLDNQARAYKADGASGTMTMDSSVALAMIAEIMRSRSAPTPDLAARQEIERLTTSVAQLQAALMFWMPSVTASTDKDFDRSTGDDAYLLFGYAGEFPKTCWGDDQVARAEAAESALAAQAQRRDEVVEALRGLLDRYTELVNCGDCGNWDPEKEPVVIASRAALNTPEPK